MYQKHQISLPVGYKTARPKTGDWEGLWRQFRTPSLLKNRFLRRSYFLINNALLYHFLANWLPHNKRMSEKSVFREAWSPELTSQSFPVPCFWSHGFVPNRKWNLMLLVHQNTGKQNRYGKNFFSVVISTLGRFDRANKKKNCRIHFTLGRRLSLNWCRHQTERWFENKFIPWSCKLGFYLPHHRFKSKVKLWPARNFKASTRFVFMKICSLAESIGDPNTVSAIT